MDGITGIAGVPGTAGVGRGCATAGTANAATNIEENNKALVCMMVSW
jgi:hypothetical protein